MTHYTKYMQHIHNQAIASAIEMAVLCVTEDILELLIKTGVKPHAELLKKIRSLQKYEYGKITPINNEPCASE